MEGETRKSFGIKRYDKVHITTVKRLITKADVCTVTASSDERLTKGKRSKLQLRNLPMVIN